MGKGTPWKTLDWSKSDEELAEKYGVKPKTVSQKRSKYDPKYKSKQDGSINVRLPIILKRAIQYQALLLGMKDSEWIRCVFAYHLKEHPVTYLDESQALLEDIYAGEDLPGYKKGCSQLREERELRRDSSLEAMEREEKLLKNAEQQGKKGRRGSRNSNFSEEKLP